MKRIQMGEEDNDGNMDGEMEENTDGDKDKHRWQYGREY